MSTSSVFSLDAYRGDRDARLGLALALCRPDGDRTQLLRRLWDALQVVPADRGAVVWIDEYGPGLVHTYCVLDLHSDRPRRAFALEPLRRSWNQGIPGVLDEPDLTSTGDEIFAEGPRSFCSVALGSDGLRAWFLVLDSRRVRDPIDGKRADSLMFIAGECASIVIRSGLDEDVDGPAWSESESRASHRRTFSGDRFAGWRVLRDFARNGEEVEETEPTMLRFMVSRLLWGLVEDSFCGDVDAVERQVEAIRREVGRQVSDGPEHDRWIRVLEAVAGRDFTDLSHSVVELARDAEEQGHVHGARDLGELAYEAACVGFDAAPAVDAARLLGRICRRLGLWDESEEWYDVGRFVAREAGFRRGEALSLDGLGNTLRDRGRMPRARECYVAALEIAEELNDRDIGGRAHQNLAIVEKYAGRTDEALRHSWAAVQSFREPVAFYRALADLGSLFVRCGELDSAAHALEVVAHAGGQPELNMPARELRGHVAALGGRREEFHEWTKQVELPSLTVAVQAEVLYMRGLSYMALDEVEAAEKWLRDSLEFAESHGVSRIVIMAEEALDKTARRQVSEGLARELPRPTEETMADLRGPVAALAGIS